MNEQNLYQTHLSHKLIKRIAYASIILFILSMTASIWLNKGYIIFSDIDFGMDDSVYIDRIFGIFNEGFSSMNFFNLSRLFFILPFYLLSLIFSNFISHFLLKSIILGVLLISAFGMYKLCDSLLKSHFGSFQSGYHYLAMVVPALFYALNPWVIFRIQHIFLLPGYAVLPWVLSYFLELFRLPNTPEIYEDITIKIPLIKKTYMVKEYRIQDIIASVKIAFFITVGAAAIHYFFFIVIIIILLSLAVMVNNMISSGKILFSFLEFIKKHVVLWGTTFLFCSYWIIPYILSTFFLDIEPGNVNVVDTLNMFSRYSSIKNIVYLISYWWPMFDYGYYLDSFFWISGGIFLYLMVYITLYRFSKHFYISLFTFMAFFVMIFATGVNSNLLAGMNVFLVTKVPIVGHIFRDPNKLVGVMAAFFSILIGFSMDRNIFLLRRGGYGRIVQVMFIGLLIGALFMYIRPFKEVFVDGFYKAVEVPKEYELANDAHIESDGKILYLPTMENMVLNNGITNYDWNVSSDMDELSALNKTVGDFHFYSSSKDGIFQHEGNSGSISYIYSFIQKMLDYTGAQHLDQMIAWLGFDEVAYHNDVLLQDQRQDFNKEVIDHTALEPYYENDIFTLYNVPGSVGENSIDVSRNLILTKGLYSFLYALDDQETYNISPSNTAIYWEQAIKQDINFTENDLIIGDDELDLLLPLIDDTYTLPVFEQVSTGNPNTGWAKSKTNTPDWDWMLRVNQFNKVDFEYDYGEGYIYTYSESQINVPSYDISNVQGDQLFSIEDILGDFFTSGNEDILKLTVFPNVEEGDIVQVVYGETRVVENGSNLWQVASSKMLEAENLGGSFILVDALVSGINAGSLHFKIHFYDENDEEIGVAYVSRGSETANYKKSALQCNTYVPEATVKMKIDLLNSGSTTEKSYFWIHDFNIYDLIGFKADNTISVPMNEGTGDYHVYARVFKSVAGSTLDIQGATDTYTIDLYDENNYFDWVDLGEMAIDDQGLLLVPYDGVTIINNIIAIKTEDYEAVMDEAQAKIQGQQMDYAFFSIDYTRDNEVDVVGIDKSIIYPNTITGYLEFVGRGVLEKDLDVFFDDAYNFSITGNLPDNCEIKVEFEDEFGHIINLDDYDITQDPERQFDDTSYKATRVVGDYYLSMDDAQGLTIHTYDFGDLDLKVGHYHIRIMVDNYLGNKVDIDQVHIMTEDEINIPIEMFDNDQYLLTISASMKNEYFISEIDDSTLGSAFTMPPSTSQLWMIYAYNQVQVKKGDIIVFSTKVESEGLEDVHCKMFFMDDTKTIVETKYVEYNPVEDLYYFIFEAEYDGFVQPAVFSRSDGVNEGYLKVKEAYCYNVLAFAKLEGSKLKPTVINQPGLDDSATRIYFEAYNPLWRNSKNLGETPKQINFIYNGYTDFDTDKAAKFTIVPLFSVTYYFFVFISFISIIGAFLFVRYTESYKKMYLPSDFIIREKD